MGGGLSVLLFARRSNIPITSNRLALDNSIGKRENTFIAKTKQYYLLLMRMNEEL